MAHNKTSIVLAIQKVCLDVGGNLLFPLVSIIEQFLLVIQQFLMSLCRELKVWALRNKNRQIKWNLSLLGQRRVVRLINFWG